MRVTIEFCVEDEFEQSRLNCVLKAQEMAYAIDEVRMNLRNQVKHGDLSEEVSDKVDEIRDLIRDSLEERGIILDDLVM